MRVALVGTDTDCGKTEVACALLRAARAAGVRALPFKPAASGADGPAGDPERLVAAAGLAGLSAAEVCPLHYAAPVAPGLAEPGGTDMSWGTWHEGHVVSEGGPLARVRAALGGLEARYAPTLTVIEGAGGLWVPMPGGTWLPAWIAGLRAAPVVVGRLGLGTINHTLLTISELRRIGLPPRGFFLAETCASEDPSRAHNERVIVAASGLPCLGVLGWQAKPDAAWLRPRAWERLLGLA
ncbi:MAG: AAA family ATPase [Myxococcales bacterium]|nr:AAA family ATPase [Myxococcales bacterium]